MNYIVDVSYKLFDERFGSICQFILLTELKKRYKRSYYKHKERYYYIVASLEKEFVSEIYTGYLSKDDIDFITSKEFINYMLNEVKHAIEKDNSIISQLPDTLELFKYFVNGDEFLLVIKKSELVKNKEEQLTDLFSFQ